MTTALLSAILLAPPAHFLGSLEDLHKLAYPRQKLSPSLSTQLSQRMVFVKGAVDSKEQLSKGLAAWRFSFEERDGEAVIQGDNAKRAEALNWEQRKLEEALAQSLADDEARVPSTAEEHERVLLEAQAKGQLMSAPSPVLSLHIGLLRALGAGLLSRTPHFKTLVWSNQPTQIELPLPPASSALIRSEESRARALGAALAKWSEDKWDAFHSARWIRLLKGDGAIGRVSLRWSRQFQRGRTQILIYGKQGELLAENSTFLDLSFQPEEPQAKVEGDFTKELVPLAIDPPKRDRESVRKHSQAIGAAIAEEPHRLATAPILCEAWPRSAIALSDQLFEEFILNPPSSGDDVNGVLRDCGVSLRREGEWVIGQTIHESLASSLSVSRPSFRQLMQRGPLTGPAWLRSQAVYCAQNPIAFRLSWMMQLINLSVFNPSRDWEVMGLPLGHELMIALGALSEEEWNRLLAGERVLLHPSFPSSQGVYEYGTWRNQLEIAGQGSPRDVARELTYSLPTGLPRATFLRFVTNDQPAAVMEGRRTAASLNVWAEITAASISSLSDVERAVHGVKAALGRTVSRSLRVEYGDRLSQLFANEEGDFTPQAQAKPFLEWPKEIRDSFLESVTKFVRERGERGTSAPPP